MHFLLCDATNAIRILLSVLHSFLYLVKFLCVSLAAIVLTTPSTVTAPGSGSVSVPSHISNVVSSFMELSSRFSCCSGWWRCVAGRYLCQLQPDSIALRCRYNIHPPDCCNTQMH